jgi:hypothetical protein
MEKANHKKIKELFLALFVLVCVGLIFALWVNAFLEKDVETPYFYREAPELSDSYYATRTAVAEQAIAGTEMPTLEQKHQNSTPVPEATPTALPLLDFTPESDG